jgi:protease I
MSTSDPDSSAISPSEQLDEDELGTDPLEDGMEPPEPTETGTGADQHGPTPREQRAGPSLDERLAQEEDDDVGREL